MKAPFVLVGGGARSGKSRFALARAHSLVTRGRGVFIATAEASDAEMRDRIARHRAERDDRLRTIEAPLALPAAIDAAQDGGQGEAPAVVLVDCLTLWLSNLLVGGATGDEVLARVEELRGVVARRRAPLILVTNEVGMSLVPETPLGRLFRDMAGIAHQRLARDADEVLFAALGVVLRLRPGPVAVAEEAP